MSIWLTEENQIRRPKVSCSIWEAKRFQISSLTDTYVLILYLKNKKQTEETEQKKERILQNNKHCQTFLKKKDEWRWRQSGAVSLNTDVSNVFALTALAEEMWLPMSKHNRRFETDHCAVFDQDDSIWHQFLNLPFMMPLVGLCGFLWEILNSNILRNINPVEVQEPLLPLLWSEHKVWKRLSNSDLALPTATSWQHLINV